MACYRIADHGESAFHIVAHQYADETVRYAASELQKYILAVTGTAIPYFSDRCPMRGPEIRIGPKVRDMVDSMLSPESFRIHEDGINIYIEGGTSRGVLYGVYAFLETYCGFRCYTKDVERISHMDVLDVDIIDIQEAPAFEYREAYFRHAFGGDFCAKNKLNSNMGDISAARGGRTKWFNFHHSFFDLVSPNKYFETHPEYFSEINGERVKNGQLCLTNPAVFEIAKQKLLEWINENPECTIFSVAQNDNRRYCTCPSCRALMEKEGSPSGPIIHFVNALADCIKEDYPHILLHTFAYQYSLPAPKDVIARDNVIVRLCTIHCRLDRPIPVLAEENPAGEEAVFVHALQEWKAHAKRLYVWDYAVNFKNYLQPLIHLHAMAENIRFYQKNGVLGILEQGNFAYGGGASMDDLKSYLIGRLLWNPDVNIDAERTGFMYAVYGKKAGALLDQYVTLMEEAGTKAPLGIYQYPDALYLTDDVVEKADTLFREALDCAENELYRRRVEREYLAIRFLLLARMQMNAPEREEKIRAFFRDIKSHGLTEIMERASLAVSQDCMLRSQYAKDRSLRYSLYYIMQ